jgi:phosphotransacetylase
MTGVIQTIAVIITFRKSYKNSLERREEAYQSNRKRKTLFYVVGELQAPAALSPRKELSALTR